MVIPNDDWKITTLPQSLEANKNNEKLWEDLKNQEAYLIEKANDDDLIHDGGEGKEIKIVCISDTHGKCQDMDVPEGDILVHAGDFTYFGMVSEILLFNEWLGSLPHKVMIIFSKECLGTGYQLMYSYFSTKL